MLLAALAVCAAGAVCGVLLWRRLQHKRQAAARKRRLVMETLRMAIHARSSFDVHAENAGGLPAQTSQGLGLAVDPASMVLLLEYSGPAFQTGAMVHVYFRIASAQHVRFFDFYAKVLSVEPRERSTHLALTLPADFGNQQRRAFVRFEPADGTLPEMGLWFGHIVTVPPASSAALPSAGETGDLPRPTRALQWRLIPSGTARVRDVSAGGIKLVVPSVADSLWAQLEPGHLFLLQTTLNEPAPKHPALSRLAPKTAGAHLGHATHEEGTTHVVHGSHDSHAVPHVPVTLVAVGEVLRASAGSAPGSSAVGLRFRRWTPVTQGHRPAWVVLKDHEGIPPLSAWIMRRQGEQMRHLGDPAGGDAHFDRLLEHLNIENVQMLSGE